MTIHRSSITAVGAFLLCLSAVGCASTPPVPAAREVVVLWAAAPPSPLVSCEKVGLMGSVPRTRWPASTLRELRSRAAARGADALHAFWSEEGPAASYRTADLPVGSVAKASGDRLITGAAFRCDSAAVVAALRAHPSRLTLE